MKRHYYSLDELLKEELDEPESSFWETEVKEYGTYKRLLREIKKRYQSLRSITPTNTASIVNASLVEGTVISFALYKAVDSLNQGSILGGLMYSAMGMGISYIIGRK